MNNCPYCDEFKNGSEYGDRILYESENFVVFPALGPIVDGNLLIVPKKHFISMRYVPIELYPELKTVYQRVRAILAENYRSPLFFEHGPISQTKRGGCCVEHAHFQAVPADFDIFEDLAKQFKYKKIKTIDDIRKNKNGKPYFYYESNLGEKYLFDIPDVVPSQYIRKIIANKIGKPEIWDWRTHLGLDKMSEILKKLKGKF